MNYQIIHDRPGRVRVRFGPNSFNREEGYGIAALLTQKADAIQAETFPINGSVSSTIRKVAQKNPDDTGSHLYSSYASKREA